MVIVTSMSLWPTMSRTMCGGTPRSSRSETQVCRMSRKTDFTEAGPLGDLLAHEGVRADLLASDLLTLPEDGHSLVDLAALGVRVGHVDEHARATFEGRAGGDDL